MLTRDKRWSFVLVFLACWTLPLRPSIADDVYTLADHSLVVREAADGSIKATVPIGNPAFAGPCGLVAGAGRLFVVENCGGSRILVLESTSYEIVDEILLPCCISDLALSGDGSRLFALQNEIGGGAVLVWDVEARREVSGFGVGSGVRGLAVSNDRPPGNTSPLPPTPSQAGETLIGLTSDGVVEVSGSTGRVLRQIASLPTFEKAPGLVSDGKRLFALPPAGSLVVVVDLDSGEVSEIETPCCLTGAASLVDATLHVTTQDRGLTSVSRFDAATGEPLGFLVLPREVIALTAAGAPPKAAAVEGGCRATRGRSSWVMLSLALGAIGMGYRRAAAPRGGD